MEYKVEENDIKMGVYIEIRMMLINLARFAKGVSHANIKYICIYFYYLYIIHSLLYIYIYLYLYIYMYVFLGKVQ